MPVTALRQVGPARTAALAQLGVTSIFDLLTFYPRRYLDRTRRADVASLALGEEAAVVGVVRAVRARRTSHGRSLVELDAADGEESLRVVFFNQAWRERQLPVGTQVLLYGRLEEYRSRRQMTNPVVDVIVGVDGGARDPTRVGRVVALYPSTERSRLTSWEIGGYVDEALRRSGALADPVPRALRESLGLVERTDAFRAAHRPTALDEVEPARRRLAFDEFLRLQLALALRRRRVAAASSGVAHAVDPADLDVAPGASGGSLLRRFLAGHRFELTGAQRRVLGEVLADLARPSPMQRLLQGDVGSGKTMVALSALVVCVDGGRQGALLAPTEVLAEQHAASLRADLAELRVPDARVLGGERPLSIAVLTGSLGARARAGVLAGLADGSVDVVVGTHALLQEDVRFAALGVVVIDEQHRFGVAQRAELVARGRERSDEGRDPDVLVMTATPIPRTAAMVTFGDLDRSVLDEMPTGRQPVVTRWLGSGEESEGWERVRAEVARGRRAFVVCPLVEGSDRVVAASAVGERDRLAATELAGLRVGLLHGQMKPLEKEQVMGAFRDGALDVLVATVVIEVGVDVPEASVIVIEDAWRFGLAQLHQLRGRVGRAGDRGYCFLLGEAPSDEARARLVALVDSHDGFALAEIDLDLRGEGTLLGARQRGRSDLRVASLRRDEDLLVAARDAAANLVEDRDATDQLVGELRLLAEPSEVGFLFQG
ncbi:MAG: ATP-dependent DNA helicase RecG [Acidimicrobiales bacterium]